jgi:hypothetical protein
MNRRYRSRRLFLRSPAAFAAVALALAVGLSSCAVNPKLSQGVPLERALPEGALAYLKLDAPLLSAALRQNEGLGRDATILADELERRVDFVVGAFMPKATGESARAAASPLPDFVALAGGRFPSGAAGFRLGVDRAWKREGANWRQADGEIRIGFSGSSVALLGTRPLAETAARLRDPGPHPIPDAWLAAWSVDAALYIPNPAAALGASLPIDASALPLEGFMVSARASPERLYITNLSFGFADERSAVVFAPLARLFALGLVRAAWPERAGELYTGLRWERQGRVLVAAGLVLSAEELASIVGAFGR